MTHMLADVVNHGTAYPARQLGFKLAGGRQDRDDERLSGCLVRRLHAASRDGRLGWLRSAADDRQSRLCGDGGRSAVGGLHEEGHRGRSGGLVQGAGRHRGHEVCKLSGKRPGEHCYGEITHTVDGTEVTGLERLHRVFRPRHAARGDLRRPCQCLDLQPLAGWVGGASPTAPSQDSAAVRSTDRDEEPAARTGREPRRRADGDSRGGAQEEARLLVASLRSRRQERREETSSALTLP